MEKRYRCIGTAIIKFSEPGYDGDTFFNFDVIVNRSELSDLPESIKQEFLINKNNVKVICKRVAYQALTIIKW